MLTGFWKFLKPEDHEQIAFLRYVHSQYSGATVHHSPNEQKRSKFERWLMKLLNVSPGFPDLLIVYKGRLIVIELKVKPYRMPSGGMRYPKPTAQQLFWINLFISCDIPAKVCIGFDEAKGFADLHFAPLKKFPTIKWKTEQVQ